MEMDFHGMKRKRLQALCKKHGIPANLKNSEMADRLFLLFKEKEIEDPVGSGNARTEKDTTLHCVSSKNVEMIDLVTPSPGSKERSVFSAKNLKGSEIERLEFETNLSLEITREEFGICGAGEDMQSRLEEEHHNSQGGLHLAPVAVALVEFNDQLSEGEVEKLGENNNLIGDICEYEKGKAEAAEQGVHNSLKGSNMKDVNALHSSKEESAPPMVEEDEATEQGDCISPQRSSMKDMKESGYLVVEKDEAVEQGDHSSPQGSSMKDVKIYHVSQEESGYPVVEKDEAVEQGDHSSPQGSSMKDVKISHVSQEEFGYPVVEKDEAVEQGDQSSPPGSNMKDVNALYASIEESGFPMVEEDEAIHQEGDCISSQGSSMKDGKVLHQEESGYPVMEKDEDVEQGDHNSPPGSNPKDVNVLHASEEEYGFPMVEEDDALKQGDQNSSQGPSMKDVNILLVSQKESDCPIAEDVAVEQGDNNSPQGPNIKDVNIFYQEESLYPVVEDVAIEQGDHNSPQGPNIKDVNILDVYQEESVYPVMEEDVAVEQGNHNSPQGPNIKDVNILHVYQEESVYPEVEEDVAVEQGDQNIPQGPNMKEVNVLHVCLEESGYPMVEEEEVVEQGDHNSPQGSNLKDVSVMHVSQEDFGYPTVEEVQKSEGNNYDLTNTGSEVDGKDTDGKTNLTAEHSVGTKDQFQRTYPENEVKSSDVNIHQETCEEELTSPQNTGSIANLGECSRFSPCNLEASLVESFQSETYSEQSPLGDIGTCNMKESMQSSNMEKVEYTQEALHTTANVNLLGKAIEEGNMHITEGKVIGLFYNSDVHDDAILNGRSEVDTRCLDISIRTITNDDGKTNVTIEQFTDELQSSTFEDSDGTPVQFLPNDALSEVKTDFNVHEMVVSGIVFENVDMSEGKFVSSRKISLSPASDTMTGFSPKQLNNSETKVLQSETARVDVGIGDVEENMQMDLNKELVDEIGEYLLEGEIDKSGLIGDSEEVDNGICDMEENIQIIVNEMQVEESEQVIRATPSAMVLNNVEVGEQLLEGEVEKSGLNADSEEGIGFLPNNLVPSATKGFEDETYFDRSALGDVVDTFKMEESMPSDQMEKEFSEEVLHMTNDSVQEEVTRLINNSDDHEYVGVTGPEDGKNQLNMKRDLESIEKYLLNDFHTFEDASDQNSDENAPTMPHDGEMKLCTFNHQQMSASGTFSGDEMGTPPKCNIPKLRESFMKKELKIISSLPVKRARDILGASDMKENTKISKKEQVGTIISRSAFPNKRKPLQYLQQN